MRGTAAQRYLTGIDRVVARLQGAITRGEPLPELAELAGVAHLSRFHFHRVYRALAGETVGQTVARLRLSRALQLLADGGRVTDVALAVGYESPQALARAFRARLDVTPASLRGDADAAGALRARLAAPAAEAIREGAPLQVTVREVAPFEVVVLRQRGAFADLDRGYGRLFDWALQMGLAERLQRLVGLPHGDHRNLPPAAHVYDCAMAFDEDIPPPPAPMMRQQVGGGRYAVLRHVGPYEGLEDAFDRLLSEWWPSSGHDLREAPVFHHFLDDPEQVPAAILRADLHLPLGEG